jgi:predicted transcriptional regulator
MKTLVKEEAQRYAILFRQSIARGMADSEAGRGKTSEEVRQHFANTPRKNP